MSVNKTEYDVQHQLPTKTCAPNWIQLLLHWTINDDLLLSNVLIRIFIIITIYLFI
jgi:hypothetical protein